MMRIPFSHFLQNEILHAVRRHKNKLKRERESTYITLITISRPPERETNSGTS